MATDLEELRRYAVRLAPELGGLLRFEQTRADGPQPDCSAFAVRSAARVVFVEPPTPAIVIHETAHVLPVVSATMAGVYRKAITPAREVAALVAEDSAGVKVSDEWAAHDLSFVRRCLHLVHRSGRIGLPIDADEVRASGWWYGSPPLGLLIELLDDEPHRLADLSFAQIEATPPPAEFVAEFTAARRFYESLRLPKENRKCLSA